MMDTLNKSKKIPNVVITDVNLAVLELFARYYVLTRYLIQLKLFPHCKSPKAVNTRLKKLRQNGFIARATMQVVPDGQNAIPVYHLTKKGAKALAGGRNNREYLNALTKPPSAHLLYHWLGIVETHILIDEAIEMDKMIELQDFYSEWEVINKMQPNPKLHFSLHTQLRNEPQLSVSPDFGFLIESKGFRKAFYGEYDCSGKDSIRRIARKKPPGYGYLADHNMHGKHFPDIATDLNNGQSVLPFSVLMVVKSEYRRDELAQRIAERERPDLWRFALEADLTPESFFRLPVWLKCDGQYCSLLNPEKV